MKKLMLSIMAAGFAATSFAQGGGWGNCFRQGNILLYGVGTYMNSTGSDTKSFSNANASTVDRPHKMNWEVSPGIGLNITNNVTVGVDFHYTGSKQTWDRKDPGITTNVAGVEDQVKSFDYALGPFIRYSMPLGGRFFWYGQFAAHYLHGMTSTRTVTSANNSFVRDDKYKGVDVTYMPAVGINVCRSVAITFGIGGIGYAYQKWDYSTQLLASPGSEHTAKVNDFMVTFGQQFNIGVQKYFGCHKTRHHAEPMDETRHMDTNDDSDDSNKKRKNDDE